MVDNAWLTTTEAGQMLGLCAHTIRRMCDDGRLPCIKPAGTERRIARAAVVAYLEKLGHKMTESPAQTQPVVKPVLTRPASRPVANRLREKLKRLQAARHA